jgi:hypothetical protein
MVKPVTHGQVIGAIRRLRRASTGEEGLDDAPPDRRRHRRKRLGDLVMVMWPALTLIGFVLLTALVVAMGMQSTARYEREQRTTSTGSGMQSAGEPVGASPA